MTKTHICHFTGSCPYTGSMQSIRINYLEIPVLGTMNNSTKKTVTTVSLLMNALIRSRMNIIVARSIFRLLNQHTNFYC